jgi:hypothetical protein
MTAFGVAGDAPAPRDDRTRTMKALDTLTPAAALRGAWCQRSVVLSAALEAISFVTPALEAFFIRTVHAALPGLDAPAARARARTFIREEAHHSAAHRRLNAVLTAYLRAPPPPLRAVEGALALATRRLSPANRLLVVEVMEQGSELASNAYLRREGRWRVDCAFTRHLFAQHAREEIGHVSVIREMQAPAAPPRRLARALFTIGLAAAGIAYLAVAVPWIVHRKRQVRRSTPETTP